MKKEDYGEEFEEILKALSRKPEKENNIYPYSAWKAIYYAARRLGSPTRLLLCTVTDGGDDLFGGVEKSGETGEAEETRETEEIDEISEALRKAVFGMEGAEGIVCRYGIGRYLILVAGCGAEGCSMVQREIEERFRERCPGKRCGFSYS